MKVGFIQIDCQFGKVDQNIARALELISQKEADLWVLPELFNTGYQFISKKEVAELSEEIPGGQTTERLIAAARERKTSIVAGLVERSGKHFYNASILVGPKSLLSRYRKIHLFYKEKRFFSPGDLPYQVIPLRYRSSKGTSRLTRVGMMICFDWIYPEAARTLALLGADIICHPSNLVLPHCPDAMLTRCLENRIYAITANRIGMESRGAESLRYIGQSEIVSPRGEILYRASGNREEAYVIEIDPTEARKKMINPYNHLLEDRRAKFYKC